MSFRKKLLKKEGYVRLEVSILSKVLKIPFYFRRFSFRGKKHKHFIHEYNSTYSNERMIEVPIVLHFLKKYQGKRALEVGNVLSHYMKIKHDVVDKYEQHKDVRFNEDICTFKPKKNYDLVFSISTLEHVGFDEDEKNSNNPKKIISAIRNIISFTNKEFLFTFPLGFNHYLDNLILKNKLVKMFDVNIYFMKRGKNLSWFEVPQSEVEIKKYDYKKEHVLVIVMHEKR